MLQANNYNLKNLPDYYSLAGKKLLIIDDDKSLLNSLKFFFEDHEADVILANDGKTGIHKFKEEGSDIVLIDLNMPDMNGYSVISSIRNISNYTPIIVVSGTGLIDDALRSINLGAWDFISKPILNFEELERSIMRVLEISLLIKENRDYRAILIAMVSEWAETFHTKTPKLEKAIRRLCENDNQYHIPDVRRRELLESILNEIKTAKINT